MKKLFTCIFCSKIKFSACIGGVCLECLDDLAEINCADNGENEPISPIPCFPDLWHAVNEQINKTM